MDYHEVFAKYSDIHDQNATFVGRTEAIVSGPDSDSDKLDQLAKLIEAYEAAVR